VAPAGRAACRKAVAAAARALRDHAEKHVVAEAAGALPDLRWPRLNRPSRLPQDERAQPRQGVA
jgi:hypothetical protein